MIYKKANVSRYIVGQLLFCIFITAYYSLNCGGVDLEKIKFFGACGIFLLSFIYYSWYRCQGFIFNGYIIFISAFFAFNLGQPILMCFDAVTRFKDLLFGHTLTITMPLYFSATYVGMLFISFMHIGALMTLNRTVVFDTVESDQFATRRKFLAIRKVSLVFLCISFPFWAFVTLRTLSHSLLYGYDGLYDDIAGIPGFIRVLKDYYEPSLICFYFSSEYLKKYRIPAILLVASTIILPPLIIGGRSQTVIIGALFMLIYSLYHVIPVKKMVCLGIGAYFLVILLFIVGKTRHSTNLSLSDYTEVVSSSEDNPVSTVLTEMGWSMYPLAATMEMIDKGNEDFRYGSSFLWALSSVVPNLGFWDVHPAESHSNLGKWLIEKLRLDFGPGYSITAEAYLNFGYLGCLFFLFYGLVLSHCCRYIDRNRLYTNPFIIVATIVFLWFSIKTVRNSFQGTVRALFYVALPMYWMFNYYYKRMRIR